MASARPDLYGYLPSHRASPLFGRYQFNTAWWTEAHVCEQLTQGRAAGTRTCDLQVRYALNTVREGKICIILAPLIRSRLWRFINLFIYLLTYLLTYLGAYP